MDLLFHNIIITHGFFAIGTILMFLLCFQEEFQLLVTAKDSSGLIGVVYIQETITSFPCSSTTDPTIYRSSDGRFQMEISFEVMCENNKCKVLSYLGKYKYNNYIDGPGVLDSSL